MTAHRPRHDNPPPRELVHAAVPQAAWHETRIDRDNAADGAIRRRCEMRVSDALREADATDAALARGERWVVARRPDDGQGGVSRLRVAVPVAQPGVAGAGRRRRCDGAHRLRHAGAIVVRPTNAAALLGCNAVSPRLDTAPRRRAIAGRSPCGVSVRRRSCRRRPPCRAVEYPRHGRHAANKQEA
jgi:hypothetical protein